MTQQIRYRILIIPVTVEQVALSVEVRTGDAWVEIQHWTETPPTSPAAARRHALEQAAAAAGWLLPGGRWPRPRRDGRMVLNDPTPSRWLPIVTAATEQRSRKIQQLAALDDAWQTVLCDAATRSHARTGQIAAAAGIGRQRLTQIRNTHDGPNPNSRRGVSAVLGHHRARPTSQYPNAQPDQEATPDGH